MGAAHMRHGRRGMHRDALRPIGANERWQVFAAVFENEMRHGWLFLVVYGGLGLVLNLLMLIFVDDEFLTMGREIREVFALLLLQTIPMSVAFGHAQQVAQRDHDLSTHYLLRSLPAEGAVVMAAKFAWLAMATFLLTCLCASVLLAYKVLDPLPMPTPPPAESVATYWGRDTPAIAEPPVFRSQVGSITARYPTNKFFSLCLFTPLWWLPVGALTLVTAHAGRLFGRTRTAQRWITAILYAAWFPVWALLLYMLFALDVDVFTLHAVPMLGGLWALDEPWPLALRVYASGEIAGTILALHVLVCAAFVVWAGQAFDRQDL